MARKPVSAISASVTKPHCSNHGVLQGTVTLHDPPASGKRSM